MAMEMMMMTVSVICGIQLYVNYLFILTLDTGTDVRMKW